VRRAALLLAAFLALAPAARPTAAEEPTIEELKARWSRLPPEERAKKLRLYEERWGRLSETERARRLQVFREQLKDLSPEQRRELLDRLREVKRREDLEALRGRRDKARRAEGRILGGLSPALRERLKALPPPLRSASRKYLLERTVEIARERLLAGLTEDQRSRLRAAPPLETVRRLHEIARERCLDAMTPADREATLALPEKDRQKRLDARVRVVMEEIFDGARTRAGQDLAGLLGGTPEQAARALATARLARTLAAADVPDPAAARRLAGVPGPALKGLLRDLRALRTAEERRARLDAFLASLPE
jgi:hypothetical protein